VGGPSIETVRELATRYSDWGHWPPRTSRRMFNLVTPEHVRAAAGLVRSGRAIPLQIPLDEYWPQRGGRFNPIHLFGVRVGTGDFVLVLAPPFRLSWSSHGWKANFFR
jgi:hypothetical protein